MFGPPGTGKSLMVRQLATEEDVPLISLTLTHLTHNTASPEELVRQRVKLAITRYVHNNHNYAFSIKHEYSVVFLYI